jgi:hypothetical protein
MLPYFPKTQAFIKELRDEQMFEGFWSASPLLREMPVAVLNEGHEVSFTDEQGENRSVEFIHAKVEFSHKVEEGRGLSPKEFFERSRQPGRAMGEQMMEHFFREMEKVTNETGNVIDGKGQPLEGSSLLDLLDRIEFDFWANGMPKLPSIVASPELAKSLREKLPKWLEQEAFVKRFGEILRKKWEQFCERQASRRLVD